MRFLALSVLLAACGGSSSVEWAGKWRQPIGIPPGSYIEATLGGSGTSVTGSGIQHREAGASTTFTVSGTTTAGVTFAYADGTTESFTFSQPDPGHITLSNSQRTVNLIRQ